MTRMQQQQHGNPFHTFTTFNKKSLLPTMSVSTHFPTVFSSSVLRAMLEIVTKVNFVDYIITMCNPTFGIEPYVFLTVLYTTQPLRGICAIY